MADTTPLDLAHAAMEDDPDDTGARTHFYERLAAVELFVLLESDEGDEPSPQVFRLSEGSFVMVFDREDRLAAFAEAPAPYAALTGRSLLRKLAGQGIGLGLNLGVAPSSFLMGAEAVAWLVSVLPAAPTEVSAKPSRFSAPSGVPEKLLAALDMRFASAGGLAKRAGIADVTYDDDRQGHIVAFLDVIPAARSTLAASVAEALAFSGIEAGEIDVAFLSAEESAAQSFAKVALMFDIPAIEPERTLAAAPGTDPSRPPRLR